MTGKPKVRQSKLGVNDPSFFLQSWSTMNAQDSRSVYQNKGRWWEMLLFPMDPNTSWEGTANPPVIIPQSHFLRRYGWIHGDLKKLLPCPSLSLWTWRSPAWRGATCWVRRCFALQHWTIAQVLLHTFQVAASRDIMPYSLTIICP